MKYTEDNEVLKKMMIPVLLEEEGDCHIESYKGVKIFFSRNHEKRWEAKIFIENGNQYGTSLMDREKLKELLDIKRFDETLMMKAQEICNCHFIVDNDFIVMKSMGFPPTELDNYIEYVESKNVKNKTSNINDNFLFNYVYKQDYVTLNDIINSCKILIDRALDYDKVKNS